MWYDSQLLPLSCSRCFNWQNSSPTPRETILLLLYVRIISWLNLHLCLSESKSISCLMNCTQIHWINDTTKTSSLISTLLHRLWISTAHWLHSSGAQSHGGRRHVSKQARARFQWILCLWGSNTRFRSNMAAPFSDTFRTISVQSSQKSVWTQTETKTIQLI